MEKLGGVVQSKGGRVVIGATIQVFIAGTNTPAQVFADRAGLQPITTVKTDNEGEWGCYAANGRYDVFTTVNGKRDGQYTDYLLYDPADDASIGDDIRESIEAVDSRVDAVAASVAGNALQISDLQYEVKDFDTVEGASQVWGIWADNQPAPVSALGDEEGANKIGFGVRSAGAKLSDVISVRDKITNLVDGVTSNQDGIVAAVALAYASGAVLDWPAGTYVSTDTIPNFHDVVHSGCGVIKRGSVTYFITPRRDSHTNVLEVSTVGVDTNDGIGAAFAMRTTQRAMDALQGVNSLSKLCQGTWRVHVAAGTYTDSANWSKDATAGNFVEFYGDVDGSGVPTTIYDGAASTSTAALYFDGGPSRVKVTNMRSKNYRSNSVASGFVFANKGIAKAYTVNVWSDSNLWAGINADSIGQLLIESGTHDGNTNYGLRVRGGVEISIGYNGSATTNRVTIKNSACASQVRDASTGHFDWFDVINCPTGIWTTNESRTTTTGATFSSTNLAFRCGAGSVFDFDSTTTFTSVNQHYLCENGGTCSNPGGLGDGLWYDYANNRWSTGLTQHGGSPFSTSAHVWATSKTGTASYSYLVPTGTNAQMLWGTVANNALMRLDVITGTPQFRFIVNNTGALYFDAASVTSGRDNLSTLGQGAARWLNIFSSNIVLTPPASVTPALNGQMTFELTSDTQLKVKVKGSDGVVRSVTLTLA